MRHVRTLGGLVLQGVIGWVAATTLDKLVTDGIAKDTGIVLVWVATILVGGGWLIAREWRRPNDPLSRASTPPPSNDPAQSAWERLRDDLQRQRDLVREHYEELDRIIGPRPTFSSAPERSVVMTGPPIFSPRTPYVVPGSRHFVSGPIDARYLTDLFRERTTSQGQALLRPHIGQWIRLRGRVVNVEETMGAVLVQLRSDEGGAASPIGNMPRATWTVAWVDDAWRSRALALPRGAHVAVVGSISAASSDSVTLEHAEFSDADADAVTQDAPSAR